MLTRRQTALQAPRRMGARIVRLAQTLCHKIAHVGRDLAHWSTSWRHGQTPPNCEGSSLSENFRRLDCNGADGRTAQTSRVLGAFSAVASGLETNDDHADRTAQLFAAFCSGHELVRTHQFARVINPGAVVSFIYPYYKKKETVLESIGSILSQQPELCDMAQVEIIVVDDGSDDTSVSTILPPQVMYVWRNKFNYGISRSRNLGAKIANGQYLVFVDPDLILNPDYIDSVIRGFQTFDERTVLTGYLHDYHYAGCEDPRAAFGVWEQPDVAGRRFLCLAGGNMAIHRDLFAEVGGFDEDLIYGEVDDTLFGYRLSQRLDTKIVFSTNLSVRHIPHPVGLAHNARDSSWAVCARKCPEMFHDYIIEGIR